MSSSLKQARFKVRVNFWGRRRFYTVYRKGWLFWHSMKTFSSPSAAWVYVDQCISAEGHRVVYYEHTSAVRERFLSKESTELVCLNQ